MYVPVCKCMMLLCCLHINTLLVYADIEKERTIIREFEVLSSSDIEVMHERGELHVEYSSDLVPKVAVLVRARGEEEADLDLLLSKFTVEIQGGPSNFSIHSSSNIKSWNQTNVLMWNRSKIIFEDGSSISSKIEDLDATLTLYIPKISKLSLQNKYHDIHVPDVDFDLKIKQFSATVHLGNIEGSLKVEMKYGKLNGGNAHSTHLVLFDSKGTLNNLGSLRLEDKYSELTLGHAADANLQLFDSEVEMQNIAGPCNIKDKYSKITLGQFEEGEWDIFDAKIDFSSANKIDLKSKYSTVKSEQVGDLLAQSFDDHYIFGSLNNLQISNSKYTNFEIEEFHGKIEFDQSFDDKIEISHLSDSFNGFEMDGKYTKLTLPLNNLPYQLDVDCKYGKVEYDEQKMEINTFIEKNSQLQLKGKTSTANASSPQIFIRGFDNKVHLN